MPIASNFRFADFIFDLSVLIFNERVFISLNGGSPICTSFKLLSSYTALGEEFCDSQTANFTSLKSHSSLLPAVLKQPLVVPPVIVTFDTFSTNHSGLRG